MSEPQHEQSQRAEAAGLGRQRDRERAERALGELFEVMRRLRAVDGCPWDRAQTPRSLRPYILEESFELVEALDSGEVADIREELGDLLFQVYFQAEVFRERELFGLAEVADGIRAKLVRRHPHVFGDGPREDGAAVPRRWAEHKREERAKAGKPLSALEGVPRSLPSLARAQRLQERASLTGFDWPSVDGVLAKLEEERAELAEAMAAGDATAIEAELGDVLFSVVNLARFVNTNAEDALRAANRRFEERFRLVEDALESSGRRASSCSLEELEELWQRAKALRAEAEAGPRSSVPPGHEGAS